MGFKLTLLCMLDPDHGTSNVTCRMNREPAPALCCPYLAIRAAQGNVALGSIWRWGAGNEWSKQNGGSPRALSSRKPLSEQTPQSPYAKEAGREQIEAPRLISQALREFATPLHRAPCEPYLVGQVIAAAVYTAITHPLPLTCIPKRLHTLDFFSRPHTQIPSPSNSPVDLMT